MQSGAPTAEPEEPRGEEDRRNAEPEPEHEEEAAAPDVEAACPTNFGNSDIFGWTSEP